MGGAFKVPAKDALEEGDFVTEFSAFLSTATVRLLSISREDFQQAKRLAEDDDKLDAALAAIPTVAVQRPDEKKSSQKRGLFAQKDLVRTSSTRSIPTTPGKMESI